MGDLIEKMVQYFLQDREVRHVNNERLDTSLVPLNRPSRSNGCVALGRTSWGFSNSEIRAWSTAFISTFLISHSTTVT